MGALRYVLIPITDDLSRRLSELSNALDYGAIAAVGRVATVDALVEVFEKLLAVVGCEVEERDE